MATVNHLKRRIGQRVMFGFEGTKVPPEYARLDEEWGLGGYILFKRNLEDIEQIITLNEDLWSMGQGTPPFIGVDQEGGTVHRLPEPFTHFPEMGQLDKVQSVSVAYEVGAVMSRELNAAGFNLNFAPVLDLNTNPDSPVIGMRAISANHEKVTVTARALVRGMQDHAVIACGKHFPGHGSTREDSHKTLPTCDLTLEKLRKAELKPYMAMMTDKSPQIDMIMMAHVMYPKIDPDFPATLSRKIQQELLRMELGFKGLIITDDLGMKAISDRMSVEDAVFAGLEAGVDIFMMCHNLDKQMEVLEALMKAAETNRYPRHLWERGFQRVHSVKARHFRVVRTIDRAHAKELVGNREHTRIARRMKDGR